MARPSAPHLALPWPNRVASITDEGRELLRALAKGLSTAAALASFCGWVKPMCTRYLHLLVDYGFVTHKPVRKQCDGRTRLVPVYSLTEDGKLMVRILGGDMSAVRVAKLRARREPRLRDDDLDAVEAA